MTFADLGLSDELLRAVTEAGYDEPTPIQRQAIPSVLMNRDLIGIAQTGTGKTASFVLPMIDILAHGRSRARMPRSLILEPTRELAAQVAENFEKYGKHHKLSMALLIGGVSMGDQVKALEKGVDVLIATPGRLMDLFGRGNILLTGCSLLVIDEADRMLDMGFIPDIEQICSKLPSTRQTLLFSATMPGPIKKLADKFLSNPKTIEVARPATANASIDQRVLKVDSRKKRQVLTDRIAANDVRTAIVFCNRKTTVRELAQSLKRAGLRAGEIHGDMEQAERIRELDRFKEGEINILVASDVAARGIDVKDVSHVFNYDVPWQPDDYIHRIGRTGRAGRTGVAITLATSADGEAIQAIEKMIGGKLAEMEALPGHQPASPPEAADGESENEERPRRGRGRGRAKAEEADAAEAEKPRRRGRGARAEATESAETPRARSAPAAEPEEAEARPPQSEEPVQPRARRPEREAERPRRDERSDRRPRREDNRRDADEGPDEGWNGPIPDFLAHGFGY
ncbi:DEAD/DEAH box helicase [Sphingosinicella sp. BN140058]|uniref:DEAD/DEAH box helicase n=1 Tax=Sphingosinicella sp. BN140058 TaxID=1892855 RepID=UPI0010134493|nr:DEAD/DEAH box helicase [Sphingosinicella sp. BN140058]QAY75259.1 DEAD/DEAH box helicase [Sphingosinicella sp. BN140058]